MAKYRDGVNGLGLFGSCGLMLIAMSAAVLLPGCTNSGGDGDAGSKDQPPQVEPIVIKGQTYQLELALTPDEWEQGLSDRQTLADDGGMLFVFDAPSYRYFVMRRCYFPIDLIYVDDDGYIDSMHRMSVIEPVGGAAWKNPPRGYSSVGWVLYAIELKGGSLDQLGLERGDKLDLPFEALESRAE